MSDSENASFRVLQEDVVLMRPSNDDGRASEVRTALAERAKGGPFFVIADFTGVKRLHSEAGSRGGDIVDPAWIRGAVFINAGTSVKLGLKVFRLAMLLKGKEFPMEHVSSLEEALATVERLRTRDLSSTG